MTQTLALIDADVADWFHGHAVPGITLVKLVITQICSFPATSLGDGEEQ